MCLLTTADSLMRPRLANHLTPRPPAAASGTKLLRTMRAPRQTTYAVRWCPSIDETISALEQSLNGRQSLWVTTGTPHRLHRETFFEPALQRIAPEALHVLECSERTKTIAEVEHVCSWAQQANLGRSSVLVSMGGGVSSDIVTVAASLLRRGIAHIRVPTTLLGIVDAAIGAKGAVNFGGRKNSLGCFHAPDEVILAPEFLTTLSRQHLRSGVGEMLKAAMAADAHLFGALEKHGPALIQEPESLSEQLQRELVWAAADLMLTELEPNLYEQRSFVRTMDFAHTFGPLLEVASDYQLTHGEAVAVDIAFSTVLAHEIGWLTTPDFERILSLMQRLGLVRYHEQLDVATCVAAIGESVQQRGGTLLLWLPVKIGTVDCLTDLDILTPEVFERSLKKWRVKCS